MTMDDSSDIAQIPRHPISVVAQRTGLTQDLLRVWERRYAVVAPGRAEGGQRIYSDADIARLRLLRDATRVGRSIGQIAALPTAALAQLVAEDQASEGEDRREEERREERGLVEATVGLAGELDGARLDTTLRRAAVRLGLDQFVTSVAVPALRRIGDEWHAGRLSPAHEHLASSIFHDIIADQLRLARPDPSGLVIVVATPPGERHVNGAVAVAAIAAVSGWKVIYLGADLPAADIAAAARAAGAVMVALSLTHLADRKRTVDEVRALRDALPASISLLVGGGGALASRRDLALTGVEVVEPGADVAQLLDRFAERRGG
jgi:DNA-binding transcriptional MerR regulator/methylmalonyl-CoA mutase cobalamin-binding subunit